MVGKEGADAGAMHVLADARWNAVAEIAARIAAGDPLDDTLRTIATWARALLGKGPPFLAHTAAEHAAVGVRPAGAWLLTPDRKQLELRGEVDFPPEQKRMRIASDHGLPGLVTQTGHALLVTNTDHEARFTQIIKTGRVGSTLQIPLKVDGDCIGITFVAAMAKGTYWPPDLEAMKVFNDLAASAIRAAGGYH